MPAPQMIPDRRQPRSVTITLTNHVFDLFPTYSVQVDVVREDELSGTIARWERSHDDLDRMPDTVRDLVDAFLWGEGMKALNAVAAHEDMSAQAKRVRLSLRRS